MLPVALAGQCLLLAVYAELASEFPVAGGAYQWTRRLMGAALRLDHRLGGDLRLRAANTTIAYLGAPWALTLPASSRRRTRSCSRGWCSSSSARSRARSGWRPRPRREGGIAAELVASVGIGLALLLVFREQDLSLLTDTLGAEALSGGLGRAGLLAALAVGGWVFIGFDACIGASEETRDAARHVPRAIWIALLSVGVLVMLNAVAATLAHPTRGRRRRRGPRSGHDGGGRVVRVVVAKPFAAMVLVAFLACGMAAQALTARTIYSVARDGVLPASGSCGASTAGRADRRDRRDRESPASACCSACTRPPSAA